MAKKKIKTEEPEIDFTFEESLFEPVKVIETPKKVENLDESYNEVYELEKQINVLKAQLDALKEKQDGVKEVIIKNMALNESKTVTTDCMTITYVAPTTRTTVDSTKLKTAHPDIYEECSKVSEVKASLRIKILQ